MVIAVIADIVGSRTLADRAAAQRDLESALERASLAMPEHARTADPLRAVVGDDE